MTAKGKPGGLPRGRPGKAPAGNAGKRPGMRKLNVAGYGRGSPPRPPNRPRRPR